MSDLINFSQEKIVQELPDRFRPVIDYELCKGCKRCVRECSYQADRRQGDEASENQVAKDAFESAVTKPWSFVTVKCGQFEGVSHAVAALRSVLLVL